jgi:hypothetical protein
VTTQEHLPSCRPGAVMAACESGVSPATAGEKMVDLVQTPSGASYGEAWTVAGVRKVLLPSRRSGSLVVGPDGRIALAAHVVASTLRPTSIGPAIAHYGGSSAPAPSTFGQRVLGLGSSFAASIYPAATGHEFVCVVAGDEDAQTGLSAPGVASTSAAVALSPPVCDLQSLGWSPAAEQPALFVVSGRGRLHTLRPNSVCVRRRKRRDTGPSAAMAGESGENAIFEEGDVCTELAAGGSVEKGNASAGSTAGGNVEKGASFVDSAAGGHVEEEKSSAKSAAGGNVQEGQVSTESPAGGNVEEVKASTKSAAGGIFEEGKAVAESSAGGIVKERKVSGEEPLNDESTFTWGENGPSRWHVVKHALSAEREKPGEYFPPDDVQCVDCSYLSLYVSSACQDSGAISPRRVPVMAVGTAAGASCWMFLDGIESQPAFAHAVESEWTSTVKWLSLPASRSGSSRDSALLAVGVNCSVHVYRASIVWKAAAAEDSSNTELCLEVISLWDSGQLSRGAIVALSWWWDIRDDSSGRKTAGDPPTSQTRRQLVLRLALCALNSVVALSWIFPAASSACLFSEVSSSTDWDLKLSNTNFVFACADDCDKLDWTQCVRATSSKLHRHSLVVSDVAHLSNGQLVSCSEDGNVWLWHVPSRAQGSVGLSVTMCRGEVLLKGDAEHPIFGVRTLHLGLCLAAQVTVPRDDESFHKTETSLLTKFKSSARLNRIVLMAPVLHRVGMVEAVVSRAVSGMIEAAHYGHGVVSCDIEIWLKCQNHSVRDAAFTSLWNHVESLQERSSGLEVASIVLCAQVVRCLSDLLYRLRSSGSAKSDLRDNALRTRNEMTELLLYMRSCAVVTSMCSMLSLEAAVEEKSQLEQLSRLEICSMFSTCKFVLAASDEDVSTAKAGPLASAHDLVATMGEMKTPTEYLLPCSVCAFDDDLCAAQSTIGVDQVTGMTLSCPQGDAYPRCALTMLPCRDPVPLRCVGCRETVACPFLVGSDVDQVSQSKKDSRHAFSWLAGHTTCPFCRCSYGSVDPIESNLSLPYT